LKNITELLNESGETEPERKQFYEALDRNTERLRQLVETLLDFARIERGKRRWDLKPLDLSILAGEVVGLFREDASRRGFTVHLDDRGHGDLAIRADRQAIAYALWNLLDNAAKYSGASRHIDVSIERFDGSVSIAVKDWGIGVPPAERKTIFRKFVRGESALSLGIPGTGLGLAMVSQIANAHGGRIEMESNGGGSIFRLLLPLVS
jgi:two-component system phosphate regulon sensor histidine kinase PhoR